MSIKDKEKRRLAAEKRARDKRVAARENLKVATGQHRKGMDSENEARVNTAVLKDYREKRKLWTPHISGAMARIERLSNLAVTESLKMLLGAPMTKWVMMAQEIISKANRDRGVCYEDIVSLALELEFMNNSFCSVERQVTVGPYTFDLCFDIDESWRVDAEISLSASSTKYKSELWRHRDSSFYYITRGYDLAPWKIKEMVDNSCTPVVTVGSAYEGPITLDAMITEIKNATKERVAERIKNKGTVPPGTTVA